MAVYHWHTMNAFFQSFGLNDLQACIVCFVSSLNLLYTGSFVYV